MNNFRKCGNWTASRLPAGLVWYCKLKYYRRHRCYIILIIDIWYSALSTYNVQKRFKEGQWTVVMVHIVKLTPLEIAMFSVVSWSFAHYQQPWCYMHHSIALFDSQDLCKPCSGSTCQFLGFNADRSSARGVFHLRTKAAKPYCISWAIATRDGHWKHTFHIQNIFSCILNHWHPVRTYNMNITVSITLSQIYLKS